MKEIIIGPDIKGLIFDCDGTLADSMPLHMDAWKAAFKKFDTYYNEDYLFSLKGMKEIEIIDLYNKKFNMNIDPALMVNTKHEFFMKNIESVKPIEEIVEIAKFYYSKLPLAVVSGKCWQNCKYRIKSSWYIKLI